ncbi:MAG: diguanylate cyclase, partial [Eubacterium sp.]
ALFENKMPELLKKSPPGSYAFVQLNVRDFKLINTSGGRSAGDVALRHIYDHLFKNIASDELVSRFNADLFCLLLHFKSEDALKSRLYRFYDHINAFNGIAEKKYLFRFNEGVYVIDDPELDSEIIFERANLARKRKDKNNT